MARQNIYDNEKFFQGYAKIRESEDSANNLEEKPALFQMMGDVAGKEILDLGCGYGENCAEWVRMGAASAMGIDISERMISVAERLHGGPSVTFRVMAMEDLARLEGKFDIVVSSLALHYVEDYEGLARQAAAHLKPGGMFLFSQEHPMTTAPVDGVQWIRDEAGKIDHYRLADYACPGRRTISWIVDGVVKYHRTFSQLVNGLADAGFVIREMREPVPGPEVMERLPRCGKAIHKPNFLLIRAVWKG